MQAQFQLSGEPRSVGISRQRPSLFRRGISVFPMACALVVQLCSVAPAWVSIMNPDPPAGSINSGVDIAASADGAVVVVGERESRGAVVKVNASDGVVRWAYGTPGLLARAVAVDAELNVFVVGPASGRSFVLKLDKDGHELWSSSVLGRDAADVLVGADGNPVVASVGALRVSTLDTLTGATIWQTELGTSAPSDFAAALAVDSHGDILAVGSVNDVLSVVKYASESGVVIWQHELRPAVPYQGSSSFGPVGGVGVDADDDVFVTGFLHVNTSLADFHFSLVVAKMSGASGAAEWTYVREPTRPASPDFPFGRALALDSRGDVIAIGRVDKSGYGNPLAIKLSGVDGSVIWERIGRLASDWLAMAVTPDDDLVVTGERHAIGNRTCRQDLWVVKFDGEQGDRLWQRKVRMGRSSIRDGLGEAITVDASGRVVATGRVANCEGFDYPNHWAVVSLSSDRGK